MTEEVPPRRDEVSSAGIRMKTPLKRTAKVFAVSSDTKEDPTALEKIIESAVEDVSGEACEPQKVKSPRTSAGTVILETGKDPTAEEAQSQVFSAADVLCGQIEDKGGSGCSEGTAEPDDGGEVQGTSKEIGQGSREAERADELTTASEKKKQDYAAELAAKAKKLADCEATRIADLELIEDPETQCSELRSQQTQAKEQLCEVETRLSEAEEKNLVNLELELAAILQRLGLDWKLEEMTTADFVGVGPIRSSHQS
ncbi:hypothetical protein AXG93_913s1010 [Marchantia polymorpha subsp. ruderalis]|uniref:Uncharacterized protein n=1 Tax=Marchantia polymorpha subsp. ruderalis TaxID=1480154 RepID=A0A176VHL6_MARPO|nr:hypothetical protein AXG93_913s1010 [Marchantia polymorpha subsp. ruderalis]